MKTISETPLKKLLNLIKSNFFRKSESEEIGELSIDATPTTNSENLVTSGGVKKALDDGLAGKQDKLTTSNGSDPIYVTDEGTIGLKYDSNDFYLYDGELNINWYNGMPIASNSPLYVSCNGLNLSYGNGLKMEYGCNQGLTVDWSQMPVDSSTFDVDSSNYLQIKANNNLLNIGLYDSNGYASIYESYSCNSSNLNIISQSDLSMSASSNMKLSASDSILFLGNESSYASCNFPLDSGLWLRDTCAIGMKDNFSGIRVGDKKIGIEVDSSNNNNIVLTNSSANRQIKLTDNGVSVISGDSLIEATSSHILLQYGSGSSTAIEINVDGVYIGGVKYGA